MSVDTYVADSSQASAVQCRAQRVYERPAPAPWLLTLEVPCVWRGYTGQMLLTALPQCRAVMDDYGTLVPVEPWQ